MRRLWTVAFAMLVALGALAPAKPARAWGKFGHLTVCDLAYRNLTPASRIALNDLLQSKSGGITVKGRGKMPDRHYTSFNMGCLEEDEVPRQHDQDHFINVPRTATRIDPTCPGGGECTLAGISRDFATLKDTTQSRQARVFALMALGHWVGDIHQPLHVSFADDRGGNGINVILTGGCGGSGDPKPKNLHAVWDNCLLQSGLFETVRKRADFDKTWSRFTITYRAVDSLMANTSLADETALVGTDPTPWANESYKITLTPDTLYCVQVGQACQYSADALVLGKTERNQAIDQAYLSAHRAIAQDRVKRAGFRLAHLLNLALDPNYTAPLANGLQPA